MAKWFLNELVLPFLQDYWRINGLFIFARGGTYDMTVQNIKSLLFPSMCLSIIEIGLSTQVLKDYYYSTFLNMATV